MELMAYPDNHFSLAIVDPPYGIGAGGNSFKNGISKNKTIESLRRMIGTQKDLQKNTLKKFKEFLKIK